MARKPSFTFAKYEESRKRTEKFLSNIQRKAKSSHTRKKQKKRSSSYKKNSTKSNTTSRSLTAEELKYGAIGIGFILLAVLTNILTAIISAAIAIIAFVVYDFRKHKTDRGNGNGKNALLTPEEAKSLKIHLSSIELNKDIANNSNDVEAVKDALNQLLRSIDYVLSFNEEQLNHVGMSKAKLPSQRAFIVKNYNTMIEQAQERSNKAEDLP